jgi:hypothetical protein
MAAVGADGFVIVAEGSEGHPQGGRVTVYLYEGCGGDGSIWRTNATSRSA